MKQYQRISWEIQRSNWQQGQDPAQIGKLNECLLWTPWKTIQWISRDEEQLAKEAAQRCRNNAMGLRAKDDTTPLPRYRYIRIVAMVTVVAEIT